MNKRLDKLGLSEDLSLKYYVQHIDFVEQFQKCTDPNQSGVFDVFSSSKIDYRGNVSSSEFAVRKKKRFFDSLSAIPLISGTIQSEKNGTRLLVNVCAFTGIMKYITWMLVFIYVAAAIFLAFSGLATKYGMLPFLFLILHAFVIFLVFYLILRRSVSKVSENLDRDFKLMMKDLPELDPKQS
jgi:hypothetical protein